MIFKDCISANVTDAAAIVFHHGWSVASAAELTGADPIAIRQRLKMKRGYPWTPTPAMIRKECESILAAPGRRTAKVLGKS